MAEEIRNDLKLVGETTAGGGKFRHIRITGECDFKGEVDCVKLSCMGELSVEGNLISEQLKLTGECEVKGQVIVGSIRGRGELGVSAGLRAEDINYTGNIEVQGDCEVGALEINGAFNIKGLLGAEQLKLGMYGPCYAQEIGGASLVVKRSKASHLLKLFNSNSAGTLSADLIESDTLNLEYTIAKIVRGNSIIIGPGCKIDRVEYRDSLQVHKGAIVKEQIKL